MSAPATPTKLVVPSLGLRAPVVPVERMGRHHVTENVVVSATQLGTRQRPPEKASASG